MIYVSTFLFVKRFYLRKYKFRAVPIALTTLEIG
jgi:hypothetical protein